LSTVGFPDSTVRFIGGCQVAGAAVDREFWDIGETVHRYVELIAEERGPRRGDLVVVTSDPTVRVAFSRTRALRA
jgi:hypothetical protein